MSNDLSVHIQALLPKFIEAKTNELEKCKQSLHNSSTPELIKFMHKQAGSFACYNFTEISKSFQYFENNLTNVRDDAAIIEVLDETINFLYSLKTSNS